MTINITIEYWAAFIDCALYVAARVIVLSGNDGKLDSGPMVKMSNKAKKIEAAKSPAVNPAALAGDVLNEAEAAIYLRQKPRTLRLWRTRRALPHFKPTKKIVLYRRADLDQWLERSRIQTLTAS